MRVAYQPSIETNAAPAAAVKHSASQPIKASVWRIGEGDVEYVFMTNGLLVDLPVPERMFSEIAFDDNVSLILPK